MRMRRNNIKYIIMIGHGEEEMILYFLFFPIQLWDETDDWDWGHFCNYSTKNLGGGSIKLTTK